MGVLARNFTLFPKLCEIRKIHPVFGFVLEKVIVTLSQMQNKCVFDKPGEFLLEILSWYKREAFLNIFCKGNGFHGYCLPFCFFYLILQSPEIRVNRSLFWMASHLITFFLSLPFFFHPPGLFPFLFQAVFVNFVRKDSKIDLIRWEHQNSWYITQMLLWKRSQIR